jgi:hypothetical protein
MSPHSPTPADPKPLVYGYLCVEEPDEVQISLLCKDMTTFCKLNGYLLGSIYIDRGVRDDSFARAAFTSLLDALRKPDAYAALVPTLDHLSTQEFVRDALQHMVELTGAEVLAVYEINGFTAPPVDGGREVGSAPGAPS